MVVLALACGDDIDEPSGDAARPLQTYHQAQWDPIHFSPAIETASDETCLECHKEVLERRVLEQTPSGKKTSTLRAWYQSLTTYEGEQETFHRRHLVTPLATELMSMRCNTCHQGNDPREEGEPQSPGQFTLRKQVNPEICVMCHGKFGYENMGLPGPWREIGATFQNNCMICHAGIRTKRHQVNYLRAEAIEAAATERGSDVCFGCHGGRAWYDTSFPYPRHAWPGMAKDVPAWAAGRPTESEARFRLQGGAPAQ